MLLRNMSGTPSTNVRSRAIKAAEFRSSNLDVVLRCQLDLVQNLRRGDQRPLRYAAADGASPSDIA